MALGIIGLLAFLVCLVMVIVNIIRKKPVKYLLIGAPIALIIFIVAIVADSSTTTPTSTPSQPASTPTKPEDSAITADERSYISTIDLEVEFLAENLIRLGDLLSNPQIDDLEWRADVEICIQNLRRPYWMGENLSPPETLSQVHQKYMKAAAEFNNFAPLLSEWLNSEDETLLDEIYEVLPKMEAASSLITEAVIKGREFLRQ